MGEPDNKICYEKLTAKYALQLAAPHTWPASVIPPLVSCGAAYSATGSLSVSLAITLLSICILMQSAVNTLNDYYDFKSGSDSKEDNLDASDATLLYHNLNPKSVLLLAFAFLFVALLLGVYCILCSGFICLIIGVIGAFFVVFYSAGNTPISHLPIGEFVSGFVMGGLIPLACYQVLTGEFSWLPLLWSIPCVIGIGLIMQTNNTCDIEKDIESSRKTLPVLIGRKASCTLYKLMVFLWIAAIALNAALLFTPGCIVLPFMLLSAIPQISVLLKNPLIPSSRIAAMGQICSLNITLGSFYAAIMFASRICLFA